MKLIADKWGKKQLGLCAEKTFPAPAPPQKKIQVSTSSMEEGKDDNTALLYSLMADERDNQTDF